MSAYKGFEKLEKLSNFGNYSLVLGPDYKRIRDFSNMSNSKVNELLNKLNNFGATIVSSQVFKNSNVIKNIVIDLPEEFDSYDKKYESIVEILNYFYNNGFDIQSGYRFPDWQKPIKWYFSGRIILFKTSRAKVLEENESYVDRYEYINELLSKYTNMNPRDIILEDPDGSLSEEERLIMWLRVNHRREVARKWLLQGYGQTPDTWYRGKAYLSGQSYSIHPLMDEWDLGPKKAVEYIAKTLAMVHQIYGAAIYTKDDIFYDMVVFKF